MSWNEMNKAQKSLTRDLVKKAFGNGKWFPALLQTVDEYWEEFLDEVDGRIKIKLLPKADYFILKIIDAEVSKKGYEELEKEAIQDMKRKKEEDSSDPPDIW